MQDEIQEESGEERDPLKEAVGTTLESIHCQIEEGSGKVGPTTDGIKVPDQEPPSGASLTTASASISTRISG